MSISALPILDRLGANAFDSRIASVPHMSLIHSNLAHKLVVRILPNQITHTTVRAESSASARWSVRAGQSVARRVREE